jgi:prevent-host-death family protein
MEVPVATPRSTRSVLHRTRKPKPVAPLDVSLKGSTVKATQAKNLFGLMLRRAKSRQPVFIEKHNIVQAVLIDHDTYQSLVQKARTPAEVSLDELRREFEVLYTQMQSAKSRRSVDLLLSASAEELNRTAAARAKSRA